MSRRLPRLDVLLVKRGLFPTRSRAQAAIMAGIVYVSDRRVDKAGTRVAEDADVQIKGGPDQYVSRGGFKLEHALETFRLDPHGMVCIDVGASTGGFTDCLLQRGASKVIAVDVGYGQIDWRLRQDSRVRVVERTNFRYVEPGTFPQVDMIVIDVSFISLRRILPAAAPFLRRDGHAVALVKPQFEAGRNNVGRGGIVKDPDVHRDVLKTLIQWSEDHGWLTAGVTHSPIKGARGNIEFFLWWRRRDQSEDDAAPQEYEYQAVNDVVAQAQRLA